MHDTVQCEYENFMYIIKFTIKEIFQIFLSNPRHKGWTNANLWFFLLWLQGLNVVNCTGLYSIDHSLINIPWTDQLEGVLGLGKTKL